MNTEKIFKMPENQIKKALRNELIGLGYTESMLHNKNTFLYAEGNAPYMLVAHLDTVHKQAPSIICYSKDGNYIMSPQGIGGDDRCGVYIILALLAKLPYKPYILFTTGEETGGIGANSFVNYIAKRDKPALNYIVEFDRKGDNDCVFYDCDNPDFVTFVEQFGFKEAWGTFSDISIIAPELGAAAVNLSSGYYNPHTEHEYVSVKDMQSIIDRSFKMLTAKCESPFEYIEKVYGVSTYGKYDYSCYDREMAVVLLEANTVWVRDSLTYKYRENRAKEIAMDKYGNFYQLSPTYGDYVNVSRVYPIEDDFEPEYDLKKIVFVEVFCGAYNYEY